MKEILITLEQELDNNDYYWVATSKVEYVNYTFVSDDKERTISSFKKYIIKNHGNDCSFKLETSK